MILEGIVTTLSPEGKLNVAPMGPEVGPVMDRFLLRPYQTSRTLHNLKAHPEGVFHVTDDVLVVARAAVGALEPPPNCVQSKRIRGLILPDACRYYEFRVLSIDERQPRARIEAEVVYFERVRDFFGFNRAKHAVLEAAILATRTAFVPLAEIQSEYRRLKPLVDKTGDERERQAFAFLWDYLERARTTPPEPTGCGGYEA
jgi:hypothetical protein